MIETIVGSLLRPPKFIPKNINPAKKILICAPSNAAIDEIVRRLRSGLYSENGEFNPCVVRIGSSDSTHDSVKSSCLDALVDIELNTEKLQVLTEKIDAEKRKGASANSEVLSKLEAELRQIRTSMKNDKGDQTRQQVKIRILNSADVICATLSGAGSDTLIQCMKEQSFDAIIIDEACQSVELSALVPFKYFEHKLFLVGDPNQLPPTVFSETSKNFLYNQSLFQRMQKLSPESVLFLQVQYRMHPSISYFPSQHFYQGNLIDGVRVYFLCNFSQT
jgi:senataxin